MGAALVSWLLLQSAGPAQRARAQYAAPVASETWCSVPNYRYYRWTPTKARGYQQSDTLTCALTTGKPDGCFCLSYAECRSGYCVPDALGAGFCTYPIAQVAEIEFWRHSAPVRTRKVADNIFNAFRVVNNADVPQTWGVWELQFYTDTSCSTPLASGSAISSSARANGFGHSVDHTAPMGLHNTDRTFWQSRPFAPHMSFERHGPVAYAFDGDVTTNWWPNCRNPCRARTEWLGLEFPGAVQNGVKCLRILQDKDKDYASFSLTLEGRHSSIGSWHKMTTFNAATRPYGGIWEQLSVPQGVSFPASVAHARALDGDLNSTVVELLGTPLEFDFGVETEIDEWRWATAQEPSENSSRIHDGRTCELDGLCPRDPLRWTLEGSSDRSTWVMLHSQASDYSTLLYRQTFVSLQPVYHKVSLSITDIWPDGRGHCAARR
eukprot:TRINITY_DN105683_c0_g1_i1.p1 TRINITY_DN105683_c0_g1~~TRINITY_DN105683_c0_g1_i1.p1  ORF type:complete len:436 (+),score=44.03 TRINITY_DN105683_c0_g1_i1:50-1357(+)